MKIVIGVQTCNRLDCTKSTIESVIKWNTEAKKMSWIISDDGSRDGTRNYIESLSFIDEAIFHPEQTGITRGLERLINCAVKHGDVILYLQNDWQQTRWIDFKAVEEFYEKYPNAGHIPMIVDKGRGNYKRPSAFGQRINIYTKEKVKLREPIVVGKEKFIPGNWNYADIPGFTNLKFTTKMFKDEYADESIRVKNIHESGCDNYLLAAQPYLNIDFNRTQLTPGRKL